MQHDRPPSLPLPTTILQGTVVVVLEMQWTWFAENQRSEKRPTAWGRRQAQPGDWGRLSGCFSQIREIREKTDFRGGKGDLERERGGGGGGGVR